MTRAILIALCMYVVFKCGASSAKTSILRSMTEASNTRSMFELCGASFYVIRTRGGGKK